ncbi:MAG: bifunctional folylpolyglutamate synthase/dihydrofolate synthase [Alicyclobacillus sp.]|nr:bifunctional folylpolyglutamate synthase/dihydrofolate synthase [Alicyclobacillus sp.]
MATTAEAGLQWLQGLQRFGQKPGLERIRRVLAALDRPDAGLRFLHVAGTNGKGSVCALLTAVLAVQQRVGVFTSPSFDGYRGRFVVAQPASWRGHSGGAADRNTPAGCERVEVCEQQLPAEQLAALAERVRVTSDKVCSPDDPLTEFEALTAMAILAFAEAQVDVVVWETGLGGRLDSTNVVQPSVTAITQIGMDHAAVLGPTLRQIAAEKAGILKPGVPAVSSASGEALDVIRRRAQVVGAPLVVVGRDVAALASSRQAGLQTVHYRGLQHDWFALPLPLWGDHQVENLAVALAMYELACQAGVTQPLPLPDLRRALSAARWPGRFEVLSYQGQTVVLDGAHNPQGAAALAQALRAWSAQTGDGGGWMLVTGVLADKDVRPMLRALLPVAAAVWVCQPQQARAFPAADLAVAMKDAGWRGPLTVTSEVAAALRQAVAYGGPVCVWGSLYTVHEARKAILSSPAQGDRPAR